jgi:putative Ca2+/H+ antiporter (TMEM165/GDT1 family)
MIIFSEIGDKTFLIAALMAMKHPRFLVFSAAFSALIAMTILSAVLGHAVPTLIPKRFTNLLAAILFLAFGAKMLLEGYALHPGEGVSEEMKEVEMELEERNTKHVESDGGVRQFLLTSWNLGEVHGRLDQFPSPVTSRKSFVFIIAFTISQSKLRLHQRSGWNEQSFLFAAESGVGSDFYHDVSGRMGDRSQIATIAMAAGQDYWWVTGGAVSGHALCTAAAVIGGRAIAGRVSLRLGKSFEFADSSMHKTTCLLVCSNFRRCVCLPCLWPHLLDRGFVLF